jgi:hypothetical protein
MTRRLTLETGDSTTYTTTLSSTGTTALSSGTNSSSAVAYGLNPLRPIEAVQQQDRSGSRQDGNGYNAMERWCQEQASEQPWNSFNPQERTEKE